MIYAEKNVFSMQKLSQLMQESPPNCCKYCDCIGTCIISDDIYWLVETCSLTWTILYSEISHDTEIIVQYVKFYLYWELRYLMCELVWFSSTLHLKSITNPFPCSSKELGKNFNF